MSSGLPFTYILFYFFSIETQLTYNTVIITAIQPSDTVICINTFFITFYSISNLGHMNCIHEEEQGPNKINWLWLWTSKLLCDKTPRSVWIWLHTFVSMSKHKCVLKVSGTFSVTIGCVCVCVCVCVYNKSQHIVVFF